MCKKIVTCKYKVTGMSNGLKCVNLRYAAIEIMVSIMLFTFKIQSVTLGHPFIGFSELTNVFFPFIILTGLDFFPLLPNLDIVTMLVLFSGSNIRERSTSSLG